MARPAVFFDRDDTLIHDVPYNGDPARVVLLPGAAEALQRLEEAGFLLIVISNQSGVGRGLITPGQVEAVNREMIRQLGKPYFAAIYSCFAAPGEEDGNCRKPNPGMVLQAREEHDLDLAASFMVGDKLSDQLCARNAGCRPVLLVNPKDAPEKIAAAAAVADYAAATLLAAAEWIIHEPHPSKHTDTTQKKECTMISKKQVYRCGVCGNMVEVIAVGGGKLACCGQPMNLQEENTSDGAVEKHVPVVEQNGSVKVTVGSVLHPMTEAHYIQWIEVQTASKTLRKYLKPGEDPVAVFTVDEPVLKVREYCNLHGLWTA